MNIAINVRPQTLTDGSEVFDVLIETAGFHFEPIVLNAYNEKAALALVDGLRRLIDEHTVNGVVGISARIEEVR